MQSNHIQGLQRTTLRERALEALRSSVISGELKPDQHLSEVDLAESFGISRGTVREALRYMQQERLVVSDERGRLRVRRVTAQEIREVFEVRASLESLAVRTVIDLPEEDRDTAVAALDSAIEQLRSSQGNVEAQLEADLGFHRVLCEMSGNHTLVWSWSNLEGLIRATIFGVGPAQAQANMDPERHALIVEAIRNLGVSEASTLVTDHMRAAADSLVDALNETSVA